MRREVKEREEEVNVLDDELKRIEREKEREKEERER